MLMSYALLYSILLIILGVLVINKEVTLMVLNNITFKWIFERKFQDEVKKSETNITIKEIKSSNNNIHLTRFIGYSTLLLGTLYLIIVGISWSFADFQYVKEVGTKVYMDSPHVGRNLIVFESFSTGVFIVFMIIFSTKWSDEVYEQKIIEKHLINK